MYPRIPEKNRYPKYAVQIAREKFLNLSKFKAATLLTQEWRIERNSFVFAFLFTGRDDWEISRYSLVEPKAFARTIRPLVEGLFHLGTRPILLSCSCCCYRTQKEEVSRILGIDMALERMSGEIVVAASKNPVRIGKIF